MNYLYSIFIQINVAQSASLKDDSDMQKTPQMHNHKKR